LQLGIVRGLRGGLAFSGASSTDLGFFGFSHCWVGFWVVGRCFLFVASFIYILLSFAAAGRLVRVLDQHFFSNSLHRLNEGLDLVQVFLRPYPLPMRVILVLIASAFCLG